MLTRKELKLPQSPVLRSEFPEDAVLILKHIDDTKKAVLDYLRGMNAPSVINLENATINSTPVGAATPSTGKFTLLEVTTSSIFPSFSYTPTVTAASGTFTSVAATGVYTVIGDTYFVQIDVVVTTNGTAAVAVNVTLPTTIGRQTHFGGRELGTAGFGLTATANPGSNSLQVVKYDGTYPAASGSTLRLSGFFK